MQEMHAAAAALQLELHLQLQQQQQQETQSTTHHCPVQLLTAAQAAGQGVQEQIVHRILSLLRMDARC